LAKSAIVRIEVPLLG